MDYERTKQNLQDSGKALKEGKMPTNEQITEGINKVEDTSALRTEVDLSKTGQQVFDKLDNVVSSTKQLVNENNKDNCIQNLIYYSNQALKDIDISKPNLDKNNKNIEQNTNVIYSNLVYLAKTIVTSNEFRGLMNDIFNIITDLLNKHDVPGAQTLEKINDKDIEQGKSKAKEIGNDLVQEAANRAKPVVDEASKRNIDSASNNLKKESENLKQKSREGAENVKNEVNKQTQNIKQKGKEIYNDLELNQKQKDHLMSRIDSILEEVRQNKEFKQAINSIFNILDLISSNILKVKSQIQKETKDEIKNNDNLHEAVRNAKKAIENFSGNKSLDNLTQKLIDFSKEIENDNNLNEKWQSFKKFIIDSIENPQAAKEKNYFEIGSKKIQELRKAAIEKHEDSLYSLFDEAKEINNAIQEDPNTNEFIKDIQSLTQELFMDSNGKPTIKYDLLRDFSKFIPVIAKRLDVLQLPRVEQSDDDYDYILDNITLKCTNVLPKQTRIRTDTSFDAEQGKMSNIALVRFSKIQAQAKDVSFYYKKKTGIIRMEDAGLISVDIPNNGLDLFVKLTPPTVSVTSQGQNTNKKAFQVVQVKCKVNEINVELKHTSHDMLYSMFSRIVQSKIKTQIESNVAKSIEQMLENIDNLVSDTISSSTNNNSTSQQTQPEKSWGSSAFGGGSSN